MIHTTDKRATNLRILAWSGLLIFGALDFLSIIQFINVIHLLTTASKPSFLLHGFTLRLSETLVYTLLVFASYGMLKNKKWGFRLSITGTILLFILLTAGYLPVLWRYFIQNERLISTVIYSGYTALAVVFYLLLLYAHWVIMKRADR